MRGLNTSHRSNIAAVRLVRVVALMAHIELMRFSIIQPRAPLAISEDGRHFVLWAVMVSVVFQRAVSDATSAIQECSTLEAV